MSKGSRLRAITSTLSICNVPGAIWCSYVPRTSVSCSYYVEESPSPLSRRVSESGIFYVGYGIDWPVCHPRATTNRAENTSPLPCDRHRRAMLYRDKIRTLASLTAGIEPPSPLPPPNGSPSVVHSVPVTNGI